MKIKKILWLIPLSLTLVGCSKATHDNKTKTKDNSTTAEQEKKTTVIFDLNGAGGSIDNQKVNDGGKIVKPTDPIRIGYTFNGWYYNNQLFDFDTPLAYTNTSITIVANWTPIDYTITVSNENNPDAGTVSGSGTYHYGDSVTIISTTNDGYTWMYWADAEGHKVVDDATYSFNMPDLNINYYGYWEVFTLNTSKNMDGGTITTYNEQAISAGTEITLEAETTTGYTWLGWYRKGTNERVSATPDFTFTMGKESLDYEARWALYTITTIKNMDEAGSILPSYNNSNIVDGSIVTLSATANTGYKFIGWFVNNEQVGNTQTLTYVINGNSVVIEARFDYDDIVLDLNKNYTDAGTVSGAGTYKYKDEVEISAETTNQKYKFVGWFLNDSLVDTDDTITITIPSADVIYEARWESKYPELEGSFTYEVDGDEIILNGVNNKNVIELVIPDYVTQIAPGALTGLKNLETLTIPFPGDRAYARDTSNSHGMGYIFGTKNYTGSMKIEQNAMGSGSIKYPYYIPASLKTIIITNCENIQYYAFDNFANVENIILPDCIKSVEMGMFKGCDSLQYNEYGNGYYIGNEENKYLVLVKPNSTYISSLVISDQCKCVTYSDISEAWHLCKSINNLYYEGTIEQWCNICFDLLAQPAQNAKYVYFYDLDGAVTYMGKTYSLVTEIVIPDTITRLEARQFMGFKNVETVVIPDSVTFIDGNVFDDCSSLTDIVLPGSLEEIWGNVFLDCTELSNVYFNGSMEDWLNIQFMHNSNASTPMYYADNFYLLDSNGDDEFRGLKYKKVTDIVIPDGTTKIGMNLSGFEIYTILIPTSVTRIDSNVLTCGALEIVYYKGTEEEWNSITISNKPYAPVYFYNESPDEPGNYWCYDEGGIKTWYFD